jgi:predicted Zn-ribbon and HTH transcriptional regulator
MALKKWRCPKCGYEIKAMGVEVVHNCPKSKNNVRLEEVPE